MVLGFVDSRGKFLTGRWRATGVDAVIFGISVGLIGWFTIDSAVQGYRKLQQDKIIAIAGSMGLCRDGRIPGTGQGGTSTSM